MRRTTGFITGRNCFMSAPHPVRIRLSEDRKDLIIAWSSGRECRYPMPLLRKKCPCATCQADRDSKGPLYIPLFTGDALTLKDVKQQGNYAIQLIWRDGHHTGIYDYAHLLALCDDLERSSDQAS